MLKKTSTEGLVIEHSDLPPFANLADFDIDGDELKSMHKKWLDERVISVIKARGIDMTKGIWKIHLTGRASKSGSNMHNMELSSRRNAAVIDYLKINLSGEPLTFDSRPLGEEDSFRPDRWEYELDRSVEVWVELIKKFDPIKLKPLRLKPRKIKNPKIYVPGKKLTPATKIFSLRVINAEKYEMKLPLPLPLPNAVFAINLYIEIKDLFLHDTTHYVFEGFSDPGFKRSIGSRKGKHGKMVPWTHQSYSGGKAQYFANSGSVGSDDFDGPAIFGEEPVGPSPKLTIFPKSKSSSGSPAKIRPLDLGKGLFPSSSVIKIVSYTVKDYLIEVTKPPEWVK